jgi:hypothetical protein
LLGEFRCVPSGLLNRGGGLDVDLLALAGERFLQALFDLSDPGAFLGFYTCLDFLELSATDGLAAIRALDVVDACAAVGDVVPVSAAGDDISGHGCTCCSSS